MIYLDFNKIKIKLLKENNDFRNFDCGNNDLNEFLKEDSLFQKNMMLNTTYLAFYREQLIGFLTVSADSINLRDLGENYKNFFQNKDIPYKRFPAIKLGRFAVDSSFQKNGVGNFLMKNFLDYIIYSSEKIGFRFVSVDAYIPAYKFYKNHYFEPISRNFDKTFEKYEKIKNIDLDNANKLTIQMFIDLYNL